MFLNLQNAQGLLLAHKHKLQQTARIYVLCSLLCFIDWLDDLRHVCRRNADIILHLVLVDLGALALLLLLRWWQR